MDAAHDLKQQTVLLKEECQRLDAVIAALQEKREILTNLVAQVYGIDVESVNRIVHTIKEGFSCWQ